MIQKLKKVAAAALVLAVGLTFAAPAVHAENSSVAPSYAGGIRHVNRDFAPNKTKRVIATTTGQQLASGEGFLDAICPFGGTAGKYSMALDSAQTAANLTVDSLSLAIAAPVYTQVDSGNLSGSLSGCVNFTPPRKFVNGLVGVQNSAGHSTLFLIHCSDGSNPCSL
jgi:hypothetical protein